MPRAILVLLVCLLLALSLGLAGGVWAQEGGPRDPGFDEMRYRAIHGRPPPPPEDSAPQNQNQSPNQSGYQNQPASGYQNQPASGYQNRPASGYQGEPTSGYQNRYLGKPDPAAPGANPDQTMGGYQDRYLGKPDPNAPGAAPPERTMGGYQDRYVGESPEATKNATSGTTPGRQGGEAPAGQLETTTTLPQYRFGSDPLLNAGERGTDPARPPGPGAAALNPPSGPTPGARPPAAAPRAPRAASSAPAGPDAPLPTRRIEVLVQTDTGQPIPMAKVTVDSGEEGRAQSGYTNGVGAYGADVPCFRRDDGRGLVHRVQVVSQQGMNLQVVESNRYNCGRPAEVIVELGEGRRERQLQREYQQRQFLYQQED